jgi:hypothetical protein
MKKGKSVLHVVPNVARKSLFRKTWNSQVVTSLTGSVIHAGNAKTSNGARLFHPNYSNKVKNGANSSIPVQVGKE